MLETKYLLVATDFHMEKYTVEVNGDQKIFDYQWKKETHLGL